MTRKAIVTGGSTGIGRSTAIALAKSGHDVAITYAGSDAECRETASIVRSLGQRCIVSQLDLRNPEAAEPTITEMADHLGGLDVFVNNAGVMVNQKLPEMDYATMLKIFNINTFGAVLAIQRAVSIMLPEGFDGPPRSSPGRIIVVTSVHEVIASPLDTLYTMTKHALGGLVKSMALDLTPRNITINAVAPGEIATPMNDMEPGQYDDPDRPAIPARRAGHPDEIASVIDFLASEKSGFVSGARWPVDGGFEAATPLAASAYRQAYLAK